MYRGWYINYGKIGRNAESSVVDYLMSQNSNDGVCQAMYVLITSHSVGWASWV